MNVARLVAFATEREKPKTGNPKNFWHAARILASSAEATRTSTVIDRRYRSVADTAAATTTTDKEDATERVPPKTASDALALQSSVRTRQREMRCHFIRSNVFCSNSKSVALPFFSR